MWVSKLLEKANIIHLTDEEQTQLMSETKQHIMK